MIADTPTVPHTRALEALEPVSEPTARKADLATLRAADSEWESHAIALLAEAVAALPLDLPGRPANVERRRQR